MHITVLNYQGQVIQRMSIPVGVKKAMVDINLYQKEFIWLKYMEVMEEQHLRE